MNLGEHNSVRTSLLSILWGVYRNGVAGSHGISVARRLRPARLLHRGGRVTASSPGRGADVSTASSARPARPSAQQGTRLSQLLTLCQAAAASPEPGAPGRARAPGDPLGPSGPWGRVSWATSCGISSWTVALNQERNACESTLRQAHPHGCVCPAVHGRSGMSCPRRGSTRPAAPPRRPVSRLWLPVPPTPCSPALRPWESYPPPPTPPFPQESRLAPGRISSCQCDFQTPSRLSTHLLEKPDP